MMLARANVARRIENDRRWWLLLAFLPFLLPTIQLAQDTGQICVLSYHDRDGDGARDADEGPIAVGIGASLWNAAGITIASALLDDSPFAANGLFCFDDLPAGDYQIGLTSAEFVGTATSTFTASVDPGAAPALLEFGARPLLQAAAAKAGAGAIALDDATVAALTRGLIGSAASFVLMSVIGILIYLLVFRRRLKLAAASSYRPGGQLSQAPGRRGGQPPATNPLPIPVPRFRDAHGAGSPPVFADDEARTNALTRPPEGR